MLRLSARSVLIKRRSQAATPLSQKRATRCICSCNAKYIFCALSCSAHGKPAGGVRRLARAKPTAASTIPCADRFTGCPSTCIKTIGLSCLPPFQSDQAKTFLWAVAARRGSNSFGVQAQLLHHLLQYTVDHLL